MTGRAEHSSSAATKKASVEVRRDGRVVADADLTVPPEPHGTASVALGSPHRDAPPAARAELVDQVMSDPAVQSCDSVHVVVPIGDAEAITRLQERTTNFHARAAGASSVIEAEVAHPASDS
jgi:hypothetical protein